MGRAHGVDATNSVIRHVRVCMVSAAARVWHRLRECGAAPNGIASTCLTCRRVCALTSAASSRQALHGSGYDGSRRIPRRCPVGRRRGPCSHRPRSRPGQGAWPGCHDRLWCIPSRETASEHTACIQRAARGPALSLCHAIIGQTPEVFAEQVRT